MADEQEDGETGDEHDDECAATCDLCDDRRRVDRWFYAAWGVLLILSAALSLSEHRSHHRDLVETRDACRAAASPAPAAGR